MCHCAWSTLTVRADESLAGQIDVAIDSFPFAVKSSIVDDTEFVRRIYLDLIGRIPTAEELALFLQDDAADKRRQLIDRLVESPEFHSHFANVLDIMWMERRQDVHVTTKEWREYLQDALAKQIPLNQIVCDILSADGTGGKNRAAAKFCLDRNVEAHALTRDVSRMFLGRDIQCAQCHDHPIVADYFQSEYYGIYSFLERSSLFEDNADNKKGYIAEKAEGSVEFVSVFTPDDDKAKAWPRLIDGSAFDSEPYFAAAQRYLVAPDKDVRAVPRFSRRELLARLISQDQNQAFAKNMANRLWAHMMGQGLVHPVDFHHSDNPASHPALLDSLAKSLVESNFDLRHFVSQIALSQAYQRTIEMPELELTADSLVSIQHSVECLQHRIETAQVALQSPSELVRQLGQDLSTKRKLVTDLQQQLEASEAETANATKKKAELTQAQADLRKKQTEHATKQAQMAALLEQTQAALTSSPEDETLKQSVAAFQQKVDSGQKQSDEFKSQAESLSQQIAEQDQVLGQLERKFVSLQNQRRLAGDRVAEARGAFRYVRNQYLNEQNQIDRWKQEIEFCEAWLAFARRDADLLAAAHSIKANESALQQWEKQIADHQQQIRQGRREQNGLQRQKKQVDQALAAAQQEFERRQSLLGDVENSISRAASAAEKLADSELIRLANKLIEHMSDLSQQTSRSSGEIDTLQAQQQSLDKQLVEWDQQIATATAKITQAQESIAALKAKMDEAASHLQSVESQRASAYSALQNQLARRFLVRSLKPLSPEQMASSVITCLSLQKRFEREAQSEWDNQHKDKKPEEIDEAAKPAEIAALLEKRIAQVEDTFVQMFAAPPASPQDVFSSTVDQALFFANDGRMRNWLGAQDGTLVRQLREQQDPLELGRALYLSVLSREPTSEEAAQVQQYLDQRSAQRHVAVAELVWGLLTSLEFRFNH
ncbi:MAG: DUF1549 domain-containing protein [Pirellulaceae bacterium]